jgi:hypothetical protein
MAGDASPCASVRSMSPTATAWQAMRTSIEMVVGSSPSELPAWKQAMLAAIAPSMSPA